METINEGFCVLPFKYEKMCNMMCQKLPELQKYKQKFDLMFFCAIIVCVTAMDSYTHKMQHLK